MKKLTLISPEKKKPIKDIGNNFEVELIYIDWKYKTITDLVNEVRPKVKNKVLAGYSIGGTVALILAQELKLDKLILYSPTPLFKEEVMKAPKYAKDELGKKRLADAMNYSIKKLNNKVKTIIYVGEEEGKVMVDFAKKLDKNLNSSLVIKQGCNHGNIMQ